MSDISLWILPRNITASHYLSNFNPCIEKQILPLNLFLSNGFNERRIFRRIWIFLQKNRLRGTAKIFRWGGGERSQFIEFLRTLHGFFYIAALNVSPLYIFLPPPPMVLLPMRKISFQRALKLNFNVMALLSNLYCYCHFLFNVCT